MRAIRDYINAIWHGAGTFAVVAFLQHLGPEAGTWLSGTRAAWLAPVLVALFSAFTARVKAMESDPT